MFNTSAENKPEINNIDNKKGISALVEENNNNNANNEQKNIEKK